MVKILSPLDNRKVEPWHKVSYVECDMDNVAFLTFRGVNVTKILNTVHGIDANVLLEGLAESLNFLRSSPYALLPGLCHLGVKAPLFILG